MGRRVEGEEGEESAGSQLSLPVGIGLRIEILELLLQQGSTRTLLLLARRSFVLFPRIAPRWGHLGAIFIPPPLSSIEARPRGSAPPSGCLDLEAVGGCALGAPVHALLILC